MTNPARKTPRPAAMLALAGLALLGAGDGSASHDAPSTDPAAKASIEASGPARMTGSFTYQGRLRNAGLPANGSFNMSFQLSDAPVLGFLLQQIDLANVPVTNGLFTVDLAFDPAHFDGEDRWLRIVVDGQGLTPRQKILPTPYAYTADTLETPAYLYNNDDVLTCESVNTYAIEARHLGNGTHAGVFGSTNSTDDNAVGILGQVNLTDAGAFSAAIRGNNNGSGTNGIGVWGSQAGTGWGVYGSADGRGVFGQSNVGDGVVGFSDSGDGVVGDSQSGHGIYGSSNSAEAVVGESVSSTGVRGHSNSGTGVIGRTASSATGAIGVLGQVTPSNTGSLSAGVRGVNNGTGGSGIGVYGSQGGSGSAP